MAGPTLRHTVFEYMANRSGKPVGIKEITEALNLKNEQVRAAMRNLISHETSGQFIAVVVPGQLWVYAQPAVITRSPNGQVPPVEQAPAKQPESSTVVVPYTAGSAGQSGAHFAREAMRKASSEVFEKVGELASGELLLRGDNGILYKADLL